MPNSGKSSGTTLGAGIATEKTMPNSGKSSGTTLGAGFATDKMPNSGKSSGTTLGAGIATEFRARVDGTIPGEDSVYAEKMMSKSGKSSST